MKSRNTIVGKFTSDAGASECLERLSKLNIPAENIFVYGVHSNKLRAVVERLLVVNREGKVALIIGLCAATVGMVIALYLNIMSPAWGLVRELGLLTAIGVGAVLGCMSGMVIGALTGAGFSGSRGHLVEGVLASGYVVVSVSFRDSHYSLEVKKAMEEGDALEVKTT
jgi:hypothetical protein